MRQDMFLTSTTMKLVDIGSRDLKKKLYTNRGGRDTNSDRGYSYENFPYKQKMLLCHSLPH